MSRSHNTTATVAELLDAAIPGESELLDAMVGGILAWPGPGIR